MNLIGSHTVFYLRTENDRTRVALSLVVFLDFLALKIYNIVDFRLQSFRVSNKTIRLLY